MPTGVEFKKNSEKSEWITLKKAMNGYFYFAVFVN